MPSRKVRSPSARASAVAAASPGWSTEPTARKLAKIASTKIAAYPIAAVRAAERSVEGWSGAVGGAGAVSVAMGPPGETSVGWGVRR